MKQSVNCLMWRVSLKEVDVMECIRISSVIGNGATEGGRKREGGREGEREE